MNAATVLSLVASAIELVMGGLALGFGRAPGWAHFRVFALIAFSAAAYCLVNTVFSAEDSSVAFIPFFARLNIAIAAIHCTTWIAFVRIQYGERIRPFEKKLIYAMCGFAGLALIPGVLTTSEILTQHVEWAGVTYRVVQPTVFGAMAVPLIFLVLLLPAVAYARKARQRKPGYKTFHKLLTDGRFDKK